MNVYNVALHKVEVNRSQYFSNDYCDEIDAGHVQYTTQQISRDVSRIGVKTCETNFN